MVRRWIGEEASDPINVLEWVDRPKDFVDDFVDEFLRKFFLQSGICDAMALSSRNRTTKRPRTFGWLG